MEAVLHGPADRRGQGAGAGGVGWTFPAAWEQDVPGCWFTLGFGSLSSMETVCRSLRERLHRM